MTSPSPVLDPTTCVHVVDFDGLRSQKRPEGKFRLIAECSKCGTVLGLDTVLTQVMARLNRLESEFAELGEMLEAGPDSDPPREGDPDE